jgi:hypothetical protein
VSESENLFSLSAIVVEKLDVHFGICITLKVAYTPNKTEMN